MRPNPTSSAPGRVLTAFIVVAFCGLALAACSFSTTNDEIKELLAAPLALFLLMHLASLVSALKQLGVARAQGSEMTLGQYLAYWPQTLATVLGNVIAFAVLVLTDQLNFAAALGIGIGVNSFADLIKPVTGRSGAIAATTSK